MCLLQSFLKIENKCSYISFVLYIEFKGEGGICAKITYNLDDIAIDNSAKAFHQYFVYVCLSVCLTTDKALEGSHPPMALLKINRSPNFCGTPGGPHFHWPKMAS